MTSTESNDGSSQSSGVNVDVSPEHALTTAHLKDETVESMEVTEERIAVFDYYSCEEAIKRLNEYLDAELDQSEREDVIRHLKVCGPCLERFSFEKTLIISLREKVRLTMAPLKLKEKLSTFIKNEKH